MNMLDALHQIKYDERWARPVYMDGTGLAYRWKKTTRRGKEFTYLVCAPNMLESLPFTLYPHMLSADWQLVSPDVVAAEHATIHKI